MTPEELERIRKYEAWLAEQEARPQTTRTNPQDIGEGAERRQNREMRRMEWEDILPMMGDMQAEQFRRVQDAGGFGGIRESERNPGRRNNTGIDWLKGNYNPDNNPFEGIDVVGRGRRDVNNMKAEQANQQRLGREGIVQNGYGSRDVGGGAMLNSFYQDPTSQGPLSDPVMNVMMLPDGSKGYGSQMPLPSADPSLLLPTGGYNAAAGVGGSGIPMSAGEAQSVGHLGNGIYAPRDASDPASQDAIMARQVLAQAGINQRLKEFYENPFSPPQVQPQAEAPVATPVSPAPASAPAVPAPQPQGPVSYGEFTGGNFFGPPPVTPSEGPGTNLLASMADQLLGGAAGVNDWVNYYLANPLMWAFTGNPEYYEPNATKAAAAKIFR